MKVNNTLDLSKAEGNILLPESVLKDLSISALDISVLPDRKRYSELESKIADKYGVLGSHIILSNGSDELIESIARIHTGLNALTITPCFERLYEVNVKYDIDLTTYQLRPENDFQYTDLDHANILNVISDKNPSIIWICSPCNPTGTIIPQQSIKDILECSPNSTVVVDEAFVDIADIKLSNAHLVDYYPNLVVLNSFSKAYGLAGMRVGFGISSDELIQKLKKQQVLFNINSLGLDLALLALAYNNISREYDHVHTLADGIKTYIRNNASFHILNYETRLNLLCIRHIKMNSSEFSEALGQYGIKVKPLDEKLGLENLGYCRIMVPRESTEVRRLLNAFDDISKVRAGYFKNSIPVSTLVEVDRMT